MSCSSRKPDFSQMLKVLNCEVPDRDVLFELFLNDDIYERVTGKYENADSVDRKRAVIESFAKLGYDYATVGGSEFGFRGNPVHQLKSKSLNDAPSICSRDDFDKYEWVDPKTCHYGFLEDIGPELPAGMKLAIIGPSGVLENTIRLTGYDNLCLMLYDDEQLAADIFEGVGSRILEYYKICVKYDSVGMILANDDWGFRTQTMLSTEQMRKYVFPWYKEIVKITHEAGKPVILHSCGNFSQIIDDLYDIGFDGRHSYEDNIMPVEEAYDLFAGKMAVIGGIDLDFICRSSKDEIRGRSEKMLAKGREKGGYALGSGNSIPTFCPYEKYLAMISAVE